MGMTMSNYALTGGATGIGAAVKKQLRDSGHNVIVVDVNKDADIVADLSTAAGRKSAVDGITAAAPGGLDGFVPCAGLGPNVQPYSLITRVNYFGVLATIRGVKDLLVKRRGSVVVISSNSASMSGLNEQYVDLLLNEQEEQACKLIDTLDGPTAYAGSKNALARWMRHNAADYARQGIRMNAVAPGITKTPLTDKLLNDPAFGKLMEEFGASIPTGSVAQPDQIASAVEFFLSSAASFCCGSVLFVDGGHDAVSRPDQF